MPPPMAALYSGVFDSLAPEAAKETMMIIVPINPYKTRRHHEVRKDSFPWFQSNYLLKQLLLILNDKINNAGKNLSQFRFML